MTAYRYDDAGGRVAMERESGGTTQTTRYTLDNSNATGYEQSVESVTRTGTTPNGAVEKEVTNTIGVDVIATAIKTDVNHPDHAQDGAYILLTDTGPMNASTRALINAAAEIVQRMFYDAYGELIADALDSQDPESPLHLQGTTATFGTNPFPTTGVQGTIIATAAAALTDLLYRGESYDAVTRLQYLRARFYDPSSGVFTSFDPYQGSESNPLSLLRYAYAAHDPVKYVDPSGNMFTLAEQPTVQSIMSSLFSLANTASKAVKLINILQDVEGVVRAAYMFMFGGGLSDFRGGFNRLKQSIRVDNLFANALTPNSVENALSAFAHNGSKILLEVAKAAATNKGRTKLLNTLNELTKPNANVLIFMPTPSQRIFNFHKIIRTPVQFELKSKSGPGMKVGVSLYFGGGKYTGRFLGLGSLSPGTAHNNPYQLFRMDWHDNTGHGPGGGRWHNLRGRWHNLRATGCLL